MNDTPAKESVNPETPPATSSFSDRLGMTAAIVTLGGGFLSTGYLIHDPNMIGLGAVFCVAGLVAGIRAFVERSAKAP